MIRDEEWSHVREKLRDYQHWKSANEHLHVFHPDGQSRNHRTRRIEARKKRGFKCVPPKYAGDHTLGEALGQMFCIYLNELQYPAVKQESVAEFYDRCVGPSFDAVRRSLDAVLEGMKHTGKRAQGKIRKLIDEVEDAEQAVRPDWEKAFAPTLGYTDDMLTGNLGAEGAEKRLIIKLWEVLGDFTNLTGPNKLEHILRLLQHFKVSGADELTDQAIRQLLRGRLRRGGQRRDEEARYEMYRQYLIQTGTGDDDYVNHLADM